MEESLLVTIPQGQLRGTIGTDHDGGKFLCFFGIPYAKPPIGELRFKAPLPAEPWTGVRDATKEGDICYSKDPFRNVLDGSEDCLFVNVFVKKSCQKLKPVIVWIHGGAFTGGSGNTPHCGPEFLMMEHIILVTINYRLGALGFLSLEDTSLGVPGNAGLKDQSLALRWVRENIKYFGGNPDNITIAGESAGAAAIHFHIVSQCSKGLFHKAILQSASALHFWIHGQRNARELVKSLGVNVCDEKSALEVLRNTPVEKIYEAQLTFKDNFVPSQQRPFGPIIEKPNDTAFITKDVIDIITSGEYNKVPILIGYNSKEGMLNGLMTKDQPMNFEEDIPWEMNVEKGGETSKLICKRMQEVYFKGPDDLDNRIMLHTDSYFVAGVMAAVKNHLETSREPLYLYRVSLDAGLNYIKNYANMHQIPGVSHADELGYLFRNAITPEIKPGSLEDLSIRRFVKLWANFARYGNPTPDENELGVVWQPAEKGKINYLDIGAELIPGVDPEPERVALWREIFQLSPTTAKYL